MSGLSSGALKTQKVLGDAANGTAHWFGRIKRKCPEGHRGTTREEVDMAIGRENCMALGEGL